MRSSETDDSQPGIESPRTLLSKLAEASRSVSENLDVSGLLQGVIDSACDLTGARYGALLTYEPSGSIQDFITSGITPEEIKRLGAPPGLGLLGNIDEIRELLRLPDIANQRSSVRPPEDHPPMKSFLGSPIHYQGERLGNIYLTEKDGGREFSKEDEEVLAVFASQAAVAIANSRVLGTSRQARIEMEALVNVTPVGVLVFDAKTADLQWVNNETRRMFGELAVPNPSLDRILEEVSLKRPDGGDIPVDELPTIKAINTGESVIADEIVVTLPDGREFTTLINARPVYGEDGNTVSVVATIQDITPLEEMRRQRMEFLNSVSHELWTPLTAIKGSTSTLLNSVSPPNPAETSQYLRVIDEQADHMRQLINNLVDIAQVQAGSLAVRPEPTDVADLLDQAREAQIRAGGANNRVELNITPDLPNVLVDRRRMLQVFGYLIADVSSNSSRSSAVRIGAFSREEYVAFTVTGHSQGTARQESSRHLAGHLGVAGGVALARRDAADDVRIAICKGIVEAHGGRLLVEEADKARGSGFTFTMPVIDEATYLAERESTQPPSARDSQDGRARVLVAVEDWETGRYVRNTLSDAGFGALVTGDPDEAELQIEEHDPHVILLEQAASWKDGFEMLIRVCRTSDAPVICLLGPGWDRHIERALELGAFDYIAKPFTSTELIARINVALRRGSSASWNGSSGRYLHGDLVIDYAQRAVSVAGHPVKLTATEYKLLTELSRAAGRVLTHEQLLRRVWGPLYSSDLRIVRQYVKEVRYKLGDDASHPMYIFTELGVGYRMVRPSG